MKKSPDSHQFPPPNGKMRPCKKLFRMQGNGNGKQAEQHYGNPERRKKR
ncbi:hypothetical protein HMPREF3038_02552 [Akkermansia sp. KLE1797]|nr:hypothetical protein HMPREF3038_02552 [Akkermansia sp. KLE1797]